MGRTDMQWNSTLKVSSNAQNCVNSILSLYRFSEPVSMASVIGVVIALLVLFVVLVIVLLWAYKKQRLCFKGEFYFSSENEWIAVVGFVSLPGCQAKEIIEFR